MTALAEGGRAPLSERGRRTRDRLVVAAREVFEERGFDATRMSDIASAAGVSHGTVYTWFPTKDDALHAAVDSVTEEMYSVLSTPEITDPIERIAVANARYLEVHRETARLLEVVAQAAVNDETFRAVLDGLRRAHVDRVAKTIQRMQPSRSAAQGRSPSPEHTPSRTGCASGTGDRQPGQPSGAATWRQMPGRRRASVDNARVV